MKTLKYTFLSLTAMILCSCIYEYPTYIPAGTKLELAFRLDSAALSSYPEISDLSSEEYDLRYVIKAYRSTNSGEFNTIPHAEFVFTKDDITSLDSTFLVELDEGLYTFYTIADYVPQYSESDHHFSTASFSDIHIRCSQYHGSTDSKKLYVGSQEIQILRFTGEETPTDTIQLTPALFSYQIVATDLKKFYDRITTTRSGEPDLVAARLEDYRTKIRYDANETIYTHMDVCSGCKVTRGEAGLWFESDIIKLNDDEVMLGFDHIMIGEEQKEVNLRVGIYRKDGTHVTTIPIKIQTDKGSGQCIKGDFMTYVGHEDPDDGVVINPDFAGDINIKL